MMFWRRRQHRRYGKSQVETSTTFPGGPKPGWCSEFAPVNGPEWCHLGKTIIQQRFGLCVKRQTHRRTDGQTPLKQYLLRQNVWYSRGNDSNFLRTPVGISIHLLNSRVCYCEASNVNENHV